MEDEVEGLVLADLGTNLGLDLAEEFRDASLTAPGLYAPCTLPNVRAVM